MRIKDFRKVKRRDREMPVVVELQPTWPGQSWPDHDYLSYSGGVVGAIGRSTAQEPGG
jgi:hypothetical protein